MTIAIPELTINVDHNRYANRPTKLTTYRGQAAVSTRDVYERNGLMVAESIIRIATALRVGDEDVYITIEDLGLTSGVVDALRYSEAARLGWLHVIDTIPAKVAKARKP